MKSLCFPLVAAALSLLIFSPAQVEADELEVNPAYVSQFKNLEPYTFTGPIYTFVNHVVGGWDPKRVSYAGTKNVVKFSESKGITTFGFVSLYGGSEMQFFAPNQVDFIVTADAGPHRFKFTQAKNFIVSGGNLTMCLCEVIRDLINGTEKSLNPAPLQMFVVSDATYDNGSWGYDNNKSGDKFTLKEIVDTDKTPNKSVVSKYMIDFVLGLAGNGSYCPSQNYYQAAPVLAANYKHRIILNNREIGTYGTGREVTYIIVESTELEKTLAKYKMDLLYPINSAF